MENEKQQSTSTPPQQKKEWFKKWWGILLIIFFFPIAFPIFVWTGTNWRQGTKIAITIFCGLFFIMVNYENSQPAKPESGTEQASEEKTNKKQSSAETVAQSKKPKTYTIEHTLNEEVEGKTLSIKVTGVEEKNSISSSYRSPKVAGEEAKFVILYAEVTNKTGNEFTFHPRDHSYFVDVEDRIFHSYRDTIGNIEDYLTMRLLSPGIKEKGVLVYQVPKDVENYSLVVIAPSGEDFHIITLNGEGALSKREAEALKENISGVSIPADVQPNVQNEAKNPEPKKKENKNWYEGGTLHKATVAEWKSATEENKLATSADFMASIDSSVSMDKLKDRAMDLKDCIDRASENVESINNQPVVELAGICAIAGDYKSN